MEKFLGNRGVCINETLLYTWAVIFKSRFGEQRCPANEESPKAWMTRAGMVQAVGNVTKKRQRGQLRQLY